MEEADGEAMGGWRGQNVGVGRGDHLWAQIPGSSGWRQSREEVWGMVQTLIQRRGKLVPASASLSCAKGGGACRSKHSTRVPHVGLQNCTGARCDREQRVKGAHRN